MAAIGSGRGELSGKVALVTGAGSGIGKAAAVRFAAEGAKVGVLSRTFEEVEETAREIEALGGEAMPLGADIAVPGAVKSAVAGLAERFGGLDVVFANAGINGVWAPIDELTPEEWAKTVSINLNGTYHTLHHAVPELKKRGGGSIVITASINGTRTFTNSGATAYAATKAAQVAMMQMLAMELARDRIRVNAICPGKIATEIDENTEPRDVDEVKYPVEFPLGQIPLTQGKAGRPDQVAELVLFLASDRSSHITGTPVWIDGAQSLLI